MELSYYLPFPPPTENKETKREKHRRQDKEYKRRKYLSNPKKYLEKMRTRRRELRQYVADLKQNLSCIKCGEKHPACLDFHHRDAKTKSFQLGGGGFDGYSKKRILEEIAKCDVLCANCHRKLHYSEKSGPWANSPFKNFSLTQKIA